MDTHTKRVAVVQLAGNLFDTASTLRDVENHCLEANAKSAQLVVFPEASLGGYPKGITFGVAVGMRTPEGRDWFRRYWNGAIDVPGPETERLQELADALKLIIVIGVLERVGGTLSCSALTFLPLAGGASPAIHRKLMPTAAERLIWGFGDGSTMQPLQSTIGRLGCAICWENYMPAYRFYLYSQGVEIWCAPTVDDREMWRASMRHIAYEGRCFVLSACQFMTRADYPADYNPLQGNDPDTVIIGGGSVIVSPAGEILAGPLTGARACCWRTSIWGRSRKGSSTLM
jgi:nitrilase